MSKSNLMDKLKSFKDGLSEEEQQAFSGMIELAARTAEELADEDLARASGGAVTYDLIAKTQSSHNLVYKTQSSHTVLLKGQSEHNALTRIDLVALRNLDGFTVLR